MQTIYPRDQVLRIMVFTGLGIAIFSQATGTEATINYIPEIMRDEAEIRDTQSDLLISMTVACAQVLRETPAPPAHPTPIPARPLVQRTHPLPHPLSDRCSRSSSPLSSLTDTGGDPC
tara:strand:+ start:3551 stop:3904 length:354 start_codon:yes stop_codon:yes gene_type:complete